MKITFINEMADLCEAVGGNVQHVAKGIGLGKRISSKFLHPGPGYGGSCFPRDTLALVKTAETAGAPVTLVEATIGANDRRTKSMANRIADAMGGDLGGKTVGILGLTFKQDTDDMRDSASVDIVPALQAAGATIKAYDPEGMQEAARLLPGLQFRSNAPEIAHDADALVILTELDQFRALDLDHIWSLMRRPLIFDLRNIYAPAEVRLKGFEYIGVGRA